MRKLFPDDIRTPEMVYSKPETGDFHVVRSYAQSVAYLEQNGLPDFISFDNDLGLDESEKWHPMVMLRQNDWCIKAEWTCGS